MTRWTARLLLLLIVLIASCAKDKDNPLEPDLPLQVPDDYTLGEAAAAATPGDVILLTGPGPFQGNVVLPPNVTLKRHTSSQWELYEIIGSLVVAGSGSETLIEGLKISNAEGSGMILTDCSLEIDNCWFYNCQGAGAELVGRCPVLLRNSDLEGCSPGILIRDIDTPGHYDDGTAAWLTLNNFLGNEHDPAGNIVFQSVTAGDTVKVGLNYWGAAPGQVDPDDTIWDYKDDSNIKGLADTASDYFLPLTQAHSRFWRD